MTDLGTLAGGSLARRMASTMQGKSFGNSDTSSGSTHGFLYNGGAMTDLGTLAGGSFTQANGINNAGHVIGSSDTSTGSTHGFLYSNGLMLDLGHCRAACSVKRMVLTP